MNSIFKNDTELIKAISSKKVYPHVKNEIVEIVKRSAAHPIDTKENVVLPLGKPANTENAFEPRAFTEVNRIF